MPRWMLAVLALICALPAHAQQAQVAADIGRRVAELYAAPALSAFSGATRRLDEAMRTLCDAPAPPALEEARAAFAGSVRAWGPVSILRFGPLVEENRFEHIFFWPDVRGVTLRQVQGVLGKKDESAAMPEGLAEKSVALQGLPAMEFVLFGSGAESLAEGDGAFRCRYGAAIAANLAERAAAVERAWRPGAPFHAALTRPAADNALYRTPGEVAGEVVKALSTALQFVRDTELLPALGDSAQEAQGRRAPLWRSNLTFALAGAQVEGVAGLLRAADFAGSLDAARRPLVDSVLFDLDHASQALRAVEAPAEAAFAKEGERARIAYAAVALDGARHSIGEQLSAAIGLTMGFNALDGD